ncbi:MAG: lysophospholipid acyltransferase family protein [Alphaproteobacteria bacterium]|nr:lysophospholipid acyltransferase family protein [Alphaproteobacteria bacterium]NNF25340.1 lauroyl acyltransferase [Paracoccaceae bacterium]
MQRARYWLTDRALRTMIRFLLLLPYRWRVPLCGWLVARVIAPLAGYDRRIRRNLRIVASDLPEAEVRRLVRAVPDNIGRSIIEIYSGTQFTSQAAAIPPEGPGLAALRHATDAGRAVILVTAHIGNYDALRAALVARGYTIGFLYQRMKNPYFHEHYLAAIAAISAPGFERGKPGLSGMIRFLKGGGTLGVLIDQHVASGAALTFFGKKAMTALSVAELALKYDAELIPAYGLRKPDGFGFDIRLEAPVPHSTAEEMTQALNNSLEAQVRSHMDQWFWIHRRWKALERETAARTAGNG